MEENCYHLLGQQSHWNINKELAKKVGIEAALLLSDLISKRQYFLVNKDIESVNEWFFNTSENIELDTTLTPYLQKKSIDVLVENGIIEVKRMGIPAKQHFKIFDNKLLKILITGYENFSQLDIKKIDNYINKNKEIRINNKNKEEDKIPAYDEFKSYVFAYMQENKYNVREERVKAKYDAWVLNKWYNGNGKKIKNWKASIINTIPYLIENKTNQNGKQNDKQEGFNF